MHLWLQLAAARRKSSQSFLCSNVARIFFQTLLSMLDSMHGRVTSTTSDAKERKEGFVTASKRDHVQSRGGNPSLFVCIQLRSRPDVPRLDPSLVHYWVRSVALCRLELMQPACGRPTRQRGCPFSRTRVSHTVSRLDHRLCLVLQAYTSLPPLRQPPDLSRCLQDGPRSAQWLHSTRMEPTIALPNRKGSART